MSMTYSEAIRHRMEGEERMWRLRREAKYPKAKVLVAIRKALADPEVRRAMRAKEGK